MVILYFTVITTSTLDQPYLGKFSDPTKGTQLTSSGPTNEQRCIILVLCKELLKITHFNKNFYSF